jgi:lipase
VSRALALHAWGEEGAPRVVCLHGVTSHGRHFAGLAERLADRHRVLAPDLLGHGDSDWEPPWGIAEQVDAVLATVGEEPAAYVGHSFGGRVAFELAARRPGLVERLALLDPAIHILPAAGLYSAENARPDRSYASFAEAIDRRYDESRLVGAPRGLLEEELAVHLAESQDGRWRYRYCQSAVVAAYGEMSGEPPPFDAVDVPTLVVLGRHSYVPYDHLLDAHRAALGDRLEVVRLGAGHTLLWDAADETIGAVERFLAAARAAAASGTMVEDANDRGRRR